MTAAEAKELGWLGGFGPLKLFQLKEMSYSLNSLSGVI